MDHSSIIFHGSRSAILVEFDSFNNGAKGKASGYTQAQYREALESVISKEYHMLKSGDRILNKAKDLRKLPEGGK